MAPELTRRVIYVEQDKDGPEMAVVDLGVAGGGSRSASASRYICPNRSAILANVGEHRERPKGAGNPTMATYKDTRALGSRSHNYVHGRW